MEQYNCAQQVEHLKPLLYRVAKLAAEKNGHALKPYDIHISFEEMGVRQSSLILTAAAASPKEVRELLPINLCTLAGGDRLLLDATGLEEGWPPRRVQLRGSLEAMQEFLNDFTTALRKQEKELSRERANFL